MSRRGQMFLLLVFLVTVGVKGQLKWQKLHEGFDPTVTLAPNVTTTSAPVTSLNPPGRGDAIMGYDAARGQLVLFGGDPGPLGDTWIYNLNSSTWREVRSSPSPPARVGAVGGVNGGCLYVTMGRGINGTYYNDVWRFNFTTERWQELMPALTSYTASPRYYAVGGIHATGKRIYVSMGSMNNERNGDTLAYDVFNNVWYKEDNGCNQYDPRCPHPRFLHSGVMIDAEEFVMFSGCLSGDWTSGPCPSHDTWRYDGQRNKWTQIDSTCPTPRQLSTMAMLPQDSGKRYALLYGGQPDSDDVIQFQDLLDDEVSVLDLDSGKWTRRVALPGNQPTDVPLLRMSAIMATGTDGIYVFGGVVRHGIFANDLWLLKGNSTDADQSELLYCAKATSSMLMVHGILMVIGVGFLMPLGALLMRYFRCMYTHVVIQIVGLCCAIAGFACAIDSVDVPTHFSFVHAIVGITTMALLVLQPFNALLKPRKPNPQERESLFHVIWRFIHRFGGRSGIMLGLANMSLGIFLAVSILPIVIAWHVWLCFLVLLVLIGEILRTLVRQRRGGKGRRGNPDGIINGWEKGDNHGYVNNSSESVRL